MPRREKSRLTHLFVFSSTMNVIQLALTLVAAIAVCNYPVPTVYDMQLSDLIVIYITSMINI